MGRTSRRREIRPDADAAATIDWRAILAELVEAGRSIWKPENQGGTSKEYQKRLQRALRPVLARLSLMQAIAWYRGCYAACLGDPMPDMEGDIALEARFMVIDRVVAAHPAALAEMKARLAFVVFCVREDVLDDDALCDVVDRTLNCDLDRLCREVHHA